MRNRRKDILKAVRLCFAMFAAIYLVVLFYGRELSFLPEIMQLSPARSRQEDRPKSLLLREEKGKRCPGGGILIYDKYCALTYWAVSERIKSDTDILTLCTQGTYDFLHHVSVLCDRWQGPISVAVYCPDQESFLEVTKVIMILRQCYTCIGDWVDWHLFYELSVTKPPLNFQAVLNNNETKLCTDMTKLFKKSSPKRRNETYPINVGRNLARSSTDTPYVFSIDIELYPSSNIRVRFHSMIQSQDDSARSQKREVWVLPVFEIMSNYIPPRTKTELRLLYNKKKIISFHIYRCKICHQIPNLTQWMNSSLNSNEVSVSEHLSRQQPLRVFSTVKRSTRFKLNFWEPFFIGTKNDPEFDTRLSWEGKSNKMQMAYEMCLLNYDFHVLDDAFLVHSPGINVFSSKKEAYRLPFAKKNAAIMRTINKDLLKKYGIHREC